MNSTTSTNEDGEGPARDSAEAIVVGVDGSPPSLAALDWAACEAHARSLSLTILHATRSEEHTSELQSQ